MKKIVSKFASIGFDTNVFIYYFNNHSQYHTVAENLFILLSKQESQIITSVLTFTELFSFKTTEEIITQLETELLSMPQLVLLDVNRQIAFRAAAIRRKYGFHLADAIQLATAIEGKAKVFITNDQRLKKFKELKVMLINEL